jgi:hypothetical protein
METGLEMQDAADCEVHFYAYVTKIGAICAKDRKPIQKNSILRRL